MANELVNHAYLRNSLKTQEEGVRELPHATMPGPRAPQRQKLLFGDLVYVAHHLAIDLYPLISFVINW